jgi:hypothetical protein
MNYKPQQRREEPTISHPFLKFNQHQLLGSKIKALNNNLPYLQAHHLGKSQTM